jgi:flavin-dependent dehydrogenase
VVAADDRGSAMARLARVPGRVRPHNRFFYFAYWKGVEPWSADVRGWMLDPASAAQFPNEDGVAVLAVGAHRRDLPEFRADLEGTYARRLAALPAGPRLDSAERVSPLLGKIEMPNVVRPAAARGMAFAGDAAQASDPLFGVGIGWAFQSAEWLVDETAAALLDGSDLEPSLANYRRVFRRRLGLHHAAIAEYASGRTTTPVERAFFRAAAADVELARAFGRVVARSESPLSLAHPRVLARVLRATVAA